MSIEYLLLFLLALVLYYLNLNKENFQASEPKCEFIAWGPSKRACIDRCRVDRQMWGGEACTQSKCYDICNNCSDNEKCNWLNTRDFLEEERNKLTNQTEDINIELRGIEGDNKCVLQFLHDTRVDIYVLQYFESANPNDGVKVFYIKNPSEGINTISISNLKNRTSYSFVLVPIKDGKQMKMSNKVVLTPNESLNMDTY
jgi:hypothetical protein